LAEFGIKELAASLIIIAAGIILTIIFGWMIAAVITPIFAFFLFRLVSYPAEGKAHKIDVEHLCGSCGGKLTWIPQHSRYYCHQCAKYPPTCPKCGKDLSWVREYSRFYCNTCKKYVEDREKT
jgi:predicted RNA-binding Zn-ribbon protein involved in translation (DUF1610 family)